MRLFCAIFLSCGAAICQQTPMTVDQIAPTLEQISARVGRLAPMLDQLHPADWIAKGAPDTYLAQWNTVREQYKAIQSDMSMVAQHPERLMDSMKALFRVQATQQVLGSLMGGTRKYQNPALADLIESVSAETAADLDRFQQYILSLAGEKDQQFDVVDREAQRCRAQLSRQPAEPVRTNRKAQ